MRNKYTKEFDNYVIKNCAKYNKEDLRKKCEKKFNMNINLNSFSKHLYRINAHCKDYNPNLAIGGKLSNSKPIGSELHRTDGYIIVKIAQPSVWEYKHRLIYKQKYGEIPKDTMVVFLDGDKNNFDINNLKAVKTRDYLYARNKHLLSNDSEVTKTALMCGELYNKSKNKKKR